MIVFLGGARDYHAIDWYRSASKFFAEQEIILLTDIFEGEGYEKLTTSNDHVYNLLIIDKLLIPAQSKWGNKWRNFIKFLVIPFQVIKLRQFAKKNPNATYNAHGMYYMLLTSIAGLNYIGTPQGSEILLRLDNSLIYRIVASLCIKKAKAVTVDSISMRDKIKTFFQVDAHVIQNGIDLKAILECNERMKALGGVKRNEYLSIRGITPLYRIKNLLEARDKFYEQNPINLKFIYPFFEQPYYNQTIKGLKPGDIDSKRLAREKMYELLNRCKVVFSIPMSDSSPRSVYEAIFCGCIVVITHHKYYDVLPQCMKDRIVIANLEDSNWFITSVQAAEIKLNSGEFTPDEEALDLFDQSNSFKRVTALYQN